MQILMIAGNVGRDAELRTTQGGDSVLGFSVAVDNGKDANGNRRESTWYDCSVWGKRAASLAPYIKKGDKLTLTGRPTARAHEGKVYMGLSVNDLTFQGGNRSEPSGHQEPASAAGLTSFDIDDEVPF